MSGSIEAARTLRASLDTALADVSAGVRQAIAAQGVLRQADDLVPVMQACVAVTLAFEALQDAAKAGEAIARAALAMTMDSTGATTIETEHHVVSLRDAARSAIVQDQAALPSAYMVARAPEPDKTAIRKALLAGESVPGATLSNGGASTIQIRSKKP